MPIALYILISFGFIKEFFMLLTIIQENNPSFGIGYPSHVASYAGPMPISLNSSLTNSDYYVNSTPRTPQTQTAQQPKEKSFWGRFWEAARGVAVAITATLVTGALLATGVGAIGILIAIGAGIAAGTAVGAAGNIATAIANGGTKEDWKECWSQTFQDFKSAAIGSISTACGFGVARLVTGTGQVAATASLGTKLFAGSAAGGTGATVSTGIGTIDQYIQARNEFDQQHRNLQLTAQERAKLYEEFLEERGLLGSQLIRNSLINVGTGFLTGGIGSKFQQARQGVQSSISQSLNVSRGQILRSSIAVEGIVMTATGIGSSCAAHGVSKGLSIEELVQHAGGSFAGGYLGHATSKLQNHSKKQNHSRNNNVQIPESIRNSQTYKRATSKSGLLVTQDSNLPQGVNAQAKVFINKNGKRIVRIGLSKELAEALNNPRHSRHTEALKIFKHELAHTHQTVHDPKTMSRSAYYSNRAFQELTARAAAAGKSGNTQTKIETGKTLSKMRKLMSEGRHKEAFRLARRGGLSKQDIGQIRLDRAENLKLNRKGITQTSFSTKEELVTLADRIQSNLLDVIVEPGNTKVCDLVDKLANHRGTISNPRAVFKKAAAELGLSAGKARKMLNDFLKTNGQIELATDLNIVLDPVARARKGISGKIRTEQELSSREVVSVTDRQLMLYKPSEIRKLIRSFPKKDRPMVRQLLKRMTQFGNIGSLDGLNNKLHEMLGGTHKVYSDKGPALASNLQYLNSKSAMSKKPRVWTLDSIECILTKKTKSKRSPAILVDEYTLQRLETEAKKDGLFVSNLRRKKIKIILPEGWDTGINFANQGKDLKSTLQFLVAEVKGISSGGMPIDRAIGKVLNGLL